MCISRSPAAFAQPGGVIMCHESAGTNYQLALSDPTQNNNIPPSEEGLDLEQTW